MRAYLIKPAACGLINAVVLFNGFAAAGERQAPMAGAVQGATAGEAEKPALPGYGQLHRDFGFPGSVRVWERGMYLNPQPRRTRGFYGSYYPYYGGYGTYYDSYLPAYPNRFYRESYDGGYHAYSLRLNHAYSLSVAPAEIQQRLAAQAARALFEFQDVMQAGHDAFRKGDYGHAARYFLLATQLNHGDPGSRLCAAHAEVALGHYDNAAALVRRALDLQPKLAYVAPDIREAYGESDDFDTHVEELRRVTHESTSAKLWFLLGYYCSNSGNPSEAARALERACKLDPYDRVLGRFAAATAR